MSPLHPAFPNFYIIGAAKSGTTTLFSALNEHPRVYFPHVKEPSYFNNDRNYAKGLEWFVSEHYQGAERFPVRGDATTRYLFASEKSAPRMREADVDSDFRILAIFREPVSRAYSMYWHMRRGGWEKRPTFEEALAAEAALDPSRWTDPAAKGKPHGYFREGCYAGRIQPFLDCFPRERILLLLMDDLKTDFNGTIAKMLRFLDLDTSFQAAPRVSNAPTAPRSRLVDRLMDSAAARRVFKVFVPGRMRGEVKRGVRKANQKTVSYPPMNADTKKMLQARYREEILAFQDVIGRDLSGWLDG